MPKLKKPKWSKPKLIILIRGKPEERVLTACKGVVTSSWHWDYGSCTLFEPPNQCVDCSSIGST